jgi:hypothetical protein
MQLASSSSSERPVSNSVDHHSARSADSFPAIVIEGDWVFAPLDQAFVDHVEHLEKGHIGGYVISLVLDKPSGTAGILLPPDAQGQIHFYL